MGIQRAELCETLSQVEMRKRNSVKIFPITAESWNFMKTFPSERSSEAELHHDITPRAELLKGNFAKILPLRQNCARGISQIHFPYSQVAEAEIHHDITTRAELQKQNFTKTFPLRQNCGSRLSQIHFP